MSDTEITDPMNALADLIAANTAATAPGGDPDKGTTIALHPAIAPPSYIDLGHTEMVRPPHFWTRKTEVT